MVLLESTSSTFIDLRQQFQAFSQRELFHTLQRSETMVVYLLLCRWKEEKIVLYLHTVIESVCAVLTVCICPGLQAVPFDVHTDLGRSKKTLWRILSWAQPTGCTHPPGGYRYSMIPTHTHTYLPTASGSTGDDLIVSAIVENSASRVYSILAWEAPYFFLVSDQC